MGDTNIMKLKDKRIRLGNRTGDKIAVTIFCILFLVCVVYAYIENGSVSKGYVIGTIIVIIYILSKMLLTKVYVDGNKIVYQMDIIPFVYRKTYFNEITEIVLSTRIYNFKEDGRRDPMPQIVDIMTFYKERKKLFTINAECEDIDRLWDIIKQHPNIEIKDIRKFK
jgi:hypothetical protein